MNTNSKISELTDGDLKSLISEKFDMTCTLRNANFDKHNMKTHKKFLFEYVRKNCHNTSIYDFDTFFMQYNAGDVVNDPYASAQSIIGALKVFRSRSAVKGTKFNNKQVEYSRSDANKRKVAESLKAGRVLDKKNVFYSSEELKKIDPEYVELRDKRLQDCKDNAYKFRSRR